MSFPRYPEYKDSGVAWLGKVPRHWEIDRLKRAATFGSGGTPSKDNPEYWNGTVPWASSKDLKSESIDDTIDHITDRAVADGAATVEPGDLMVVVRGMILAHTFPVTKALVRMAINQDLKGIRPNSAWHVDYFADLLRASSPETFRRLDEAGHGTKALRMDAWLGMDLPRPPVSEQRVIADFLKHETAKIDALAAEQQRLIELLQENRQGVISHAVTKGLNPTAPMKDSGIAWLGQIPAHWTVPRIAYVATVENGTTPSRDDPSFWNEGSVPWLASGEVNQYRIVAADEFITASALAKCSLRILPVGSVVVGMIGQGKTRGLAARLEIPACINQNLGGIVPDASINSEYLFYALQAAYEFLREMGRGGNQAALNTEIISALRLALPPVGEQEAIAEHLNRRVSGMEQLMSEAARASTLLHDRRTALISAAVTGQIDVSTAASAAA